jgi:hypothetical protein
VDDESESETEMVMTGAAPVAGSGGAAVVAPGESALVGAMAVVLRACGARRTWKRAAKLDLALRAISSKATDLHTGVGLAPIVTWAVKCFVQRRTLLA